MVKLDIFGSLKREVLPFFPIAFLLIYASLSLSLGVNEHYELNISNGLEYGYFFEILLTMTDFIKDYLPYYSLTTIALIIYLIGDYLENSENHQGFGFFVRITSLIPLGFSLIASMINIVMLISLYMFL